MKLKSFQKINHSTKTALCMLIVTRNKEGLTMNIKLTLDNTEIQELLYSTQLMFDKLIDSDPDRAEKFSELHDKLFNEWVKQDD